MFLVFSCLSFNFSVNHQHHKYSQSLSHSFNFSVNITSSFSIFFIYHFLSDLTLTTINCSINKKKVNLLNKLPSLVPPCGSRPAQPLAIAVELSTLHIIFLNLKYYILCAGKSQSGFLGSGKENMQAQSFQVHGHPSLPNNNVRSVKHRRGHKVYECV